MYSQAGETFRAEGHETNHCYVLSTMLYTSENALAKCNESLEIAKRQNDTSQILEFS